MSKNTFKSLIDNDPELNDAKARHAKLDSDKAATADRLADVALQMENMAATHTNLVDSLVSGGEVAEIVLESTLRDERDRAALLARSIDTAITRLDQKIQARVSSLADAYAKAHTDQQIERARKVKSALLDLAEVECAERAMRAKAEAEGCPGHHFTNFAFTVLGSPLTGTFFTQKLHLEALFRKYEALGFPTTTAEANRLAALAD